MWGMAQSTSGGAGTMSHILKWIPSVFEGKEFTECYDYFWSIYREDCEVCPAHVHDDNLHCVCMRYNDLHAEIESGGEK